MLPKLFFLPLVHEIFASRPIFQVWSRQLLAGARKNLGRFSPPTFPITNLNPRRSSGGAAKAKKKRRDSWLGGEKNPHSLSCQKATVPVGQTVSKSWRVEALIIQRKSRIHFLVGRGSGLEET